MLAYVFANVMDCLRAFPQSPVLIDSQSAETILDGADNEDVAFLVVGDPFG